MTRHAAASGAAGIAAKLQISNSRLDELRAKLDGALNGRTASQAATKLGIEPGGLRDLRTALLMPDAPASEAAKHAALLILNPAAVREERPGAGSSTDPNGASPSGKKRKRRRRGGGPKAVTGPKVYVLKTGSVYHDKRGCESIQEKKPEAVPLSVAKARGQSACLKCKAPVDAVALAPRPELSNIDPLEHGGPRRRQRSKNTQKNTKTGSKNPRRKK